MYLSKAPQQERKAKAAYDELQRNIVVALVNGVIWDLQRRLPTETRNIQFLSPQHPQSLHTIAHRYYEFSAPSYLLIPISHESWVLGPHSDFVEIFVLFHPLKKILWLTSFVHVLFNLSDRNLFF